MKPIKIKDDIYFVGAVDWDRRLFDSLIPIPEGTSYNAYLVQGSERTALFDTVDPTKTDILMEYLREVKNIDYIIAHHAEQDHSGSLPHVMEKYKNAKVIVSPKGKGMLVEHLHIPEDRITTVNDGDTLSLGNKTIEFIHTPWVHWPETMLTYLREDKILFTCDLFGAHFATSELYADEDWRVCDAAKRYYAEIMMPFRTTILKHLERLNKYEIALIAPSHGPVHNRPDFIINCHKGWVTDAVCNMVVLPYVSMHGSTELMANYLTDVLTQKGVKVEKFNLAVTDLGRLAMSLVDAATLVVGSPTVLTGAHPFAISAAFLANALRPKLKFASIIGTFGWAGRMKEQISGMIANLKVETLEPVIIKGKPRDDDFKALERLAEDIITKHREHNIV